MSEVDEAAQALVERAGEIYARRNPPASGESPIKGEDLIPAQLGSVTAEVLKKLGNMDQRTIHHEMPVETTLEKRGAKNARISTGGESVTILRFFPMTCCAVFYICCERVLFRFLCNTILLPSAPTSTT